MSEKNVNSERMRGTKKQSNPKGLNAYEQISAAQKQEELVKKHLKLVSYIVSRLAIALPGWIDKRDLVNAGVIGLIDAAKNYDQSKGTKFETYASTRIRGAIIDELRALDWIPRSTREKSKEIERTISDLVNKLGRFPYEQEVAEKLGWDMEQYNKTLDLVSGTTLISLDEVIILNSSGETIRRIETLSETFDDTLKNIERRELIDNVAKVIENLSEQERLVMALYYYEELTLKEIGMVLKVTESRISQIHTMAILKIRAKLKTMYHGT
jgi:RNA polymerase sigma factor FliA